MRIRQVFEAIPESAFSGLLRLKIRNLREAANAFLGPVRVGNSSDLADNLAAAHSQHPELVAESLQYAVSSNPRLGELMTSPVMAGAWLADGGSLEALAPFRTPRSALDEMHALAAGAHGVMQSIIGVTEPFRLLVLKHLLHQLAERHKDHSLLSIMSLKGYLGEPALCAELQSPAATIYANAYFPGGKLPKQLTPLSGTLAADLMAAFAKSPDNHSQKLLLRALVYNPGLRLRTAGYECGQVIGHLAPVCKQITAVWQAAAPQPLSKAEVRLVERQVMINLCYWNDEDLQGLQATPEEIMGHPNLDKAHLPGWVRETLAGPHRAFNFTKGSIVEPGLNHKHLRESPSTILWWRAHQLRCASRMLREAKRSEMTDGMLAKAFEQGAMQYSHIDELLSLIAHLSPDKHTSDAKAALAAMMIESVLNQPPLKAGEGYKRLDPGTLTQSGGRQLVAIRDLVSTYPDIQAKLTQYLERNGLASYHLLKQCGISGQALKAIETKISDNFAERYLMDELGL